MRLVCQWVYCHLICLTPAEVNWAGLVPSDAVCAGHERFSSKSTRSSFLVYFHGLQPVSGHTTVSQSTRTRRHRRSVALDHRHRTVSRLNFTSWKYAHLLGTFRRQPKACIFIWLKNNWDQCIWCSSNDKVTHSGRIPAVSIISIRSENRPPRIIHVNSHLVIGWCKKLM